jgi:hypothetical protein
VDVAYYLIHSLGSGPVFKAIDRAAAETFATQDRQLGSGSISAERRGMTPALWMSASSRSWVARNPRAKARTASTFSRSARPQLTLAPPDAAAIASRARSVRP